MDVEELEKKLPAYIYQKLINSKLDSIKSILLKNKTEIQEITKLNPKDVDLLLEVVSETCIGDKIKTAAEIPDWIKISTGCTGIDNILNGGIPINGLNEIYGESGVGKSQFCLQLALRVQLPKIYGGLGKSAVYICTEDPFPSKRLKQLTDLFYSQFNDTNVTNLKFEDNIYVEHVVDFEQLRFCLYAKLQKLISTVNIGIIIIDSITGVFRSFNEDRNYLSRSEDFQTIARKLYEFCEVHEIGIVCTNQVSDNLETGDVNPCLGLAWSNWVTSRFCISRSFHRLTRNFNVIFAPHLPCCSSNFLIKENGIVDDE